MRRTTVTPGSAVVLVLALLALTACGLAPSAVDSASESPTPGGASETAPESASPPDGTRSPADPPSDAKGLERFYTQQPDWEDCGAGGFECTTIQVPLDYADPEGQSIELAVVRLPASDRDNRLGSLVINPGGPGGSGVEYARYAPLILGQPLLAQYDIVGFDPRGVGQSTPVDCVSDAEMDDFLASDGSPDDAAEKTELLGIARSFAQGCERRSGDLLAHVSTEDAARDMDVLRGILGDDQLTYLGKSYGTFLGATYAELFPKRAGRLVLDGALDPTLTAKELGLEQAKGFEVALEAFLQDCIRRSDCPLGNSLDQAYAQLDDFIESVDESPLRGEREVTQSLAVTGIIMPLYVKQYWARLRQALEAGLNGDGSRLLALADEYTERGPDGYRNNSGEAILAVNCTDRADIKSVAEANTEEPAFRKASPRFGAFILWGSLPCSQWPVDPVGEPHPIRAAGAKPILVVGTTRDPATPYKWSEALASQLDSGVLLTRDGDGHTAYREGNECVDEAVEAYLLAGKTPTEGLECPPG